MVEALVQSDTGTLHNSPAFSQVLRRWVAAALMDLAAVLLLVVTFAGSTADSSSTNSTTPGATLTLIAVGVVLALLCSLVTIGLVRRVRQRSPKVSYATIVGGLVLAVSFVGLIEFSFLGVLAVLVGLPMTEFRRAD